MSNYTNTSDYDQSILELQMEELGTTDPFVAINYLNSMNNMDDTSSNTDSSTDNNTDESSNTEEIFDPTHYDLHNYNQYSRNRSRTENVHNEYVTGYTNEYGYQSSVNNINPLSGLMQSLASLMSQNMVKDTNGINFQSFDFPYNMAPYNVFPQTDNFENMEDVKKTMKIDDVHKYEESSITYNNVISKYEKFDEETACAICLELIKPNDESEYNKKQFVVLSCDHVFHNDCILHWFKNYNYVCPLCKKECGEYKLNL